MPKTPIYTPRPRTTSIVAHAAYTDVDWHGPVTIDDIRGWHTDKGWIDVGYHLYIRRNGQFEVGRPFHVIGAHVSGHNRESFAICLEGGAKVHTKIVDGKRVFDFIEPENNFTEAQFRSLKIAFHMALMMYPGAEIKGHRDHPGVTKACPVFDAKEFWESVKPDSL